jgi:hypothetical protein
MRARCRQRNTARGGMHGGGQPMRPLGVAYTGQGCTVDPEHESTAEDARACTPEH